MTMTTVKHSCTECANGYRTDFLAIDHFGRDDAEATACANEEAACPEHRCYYWPAIAMEHARTPERTTTRGGAPVAHHRLADYERRIIASLLTDSRVSMVGSWFAAILDEHGTEVTITVARKP